MADAARPVFDASPRRIVDEIARSKKDADGFVTIDVGRLVSSSSAAADGKDSTASPRLSSNKRLQKTLSRKGSQRSPPPTEEKSSADGDVATAGGSEKAALLVHVEVDESPASVPPTTTSTAAGGARCRRISGKRPSPWLDPRRVLFFFAALSSMGTLILLYFTLSMSKMTTDVANAR